VFRDCGLVGQALDELSGGYTRSMDIGATTFDIGDIMMAASLATAKEESLLVCGVEHVRLLSSGDGHTDRKNSWERLGYKLPGSLIARHAYAITRIEQKNGLRVWLENPLLDDQPTSEDVNSVLDNDRSAGPRKRQFCLTLDDFTKCFGSSIQFGRTPIELKLAV